MKGAPQGDKLRVQRRPRTPAEVAFEKQPGMTTVEISTIPERMMFTPTEFTVKPGQPVKLVVLNPDAMQHNLVIVRPGALEEIGMAGNEMAGYCFGAASTGEVVVLALQPEYEDRGIGRELLARVVAHLHGLGHTRLFLGCSADPAVRSFGFYRHLGWQGTGTVDQHGDEVLELVRR